MRRGWKGRRRKENKYYWTTAALDPAGIRRNVEEARFIQHYLRRSWSAYTHTRLVVIHILSFTFWEHRPVLSTLTLANMKNLLCISYWINITATVKTSFFHLLSPLKLYSCAPLSLPSGEFNLGHSSTDVSSTLAAATGTGIIKALEKQRKKNHA